MIPIPIRFYIHSEKTYRADQLTLPEHCAVCDAEGAEPISYVQGHFPIPIPIPPFGGVYRKTHVAIPYCKYHAEAFHFRFRVLSIFQYVVIAVGLTCFFWGAVLQDQQGAKNELTVPFIIGLVCIGVVLPSTLLARRLMYDAFFVVRHGVVQVKSKYPHFLEQITEANSWSEDEDNKPSLE